MKAERYLKCGRLVWYLLVTAAIILFLYAFIYADLVMSIASFILASALSKYKDRVPLPGFWTKEDNGIYK